ncbi:hypothetical protein OAF54_01865 [bacterium]|nr:hypothetical protein [bacterium]
MSKDFDEEFELVQLLRKAEALEMVEDTGDGWKTKVVPDELAQKAAKEIVQLRQEVNELRNQLNNKTVD